MSVPIHTSQNIYSDWDGAFMQYKVDANTAYICRATAGTELTATGWQIFKLYDDASIRRITWAESGGIATTEFKFTAASYAGYSYS